MQRPPLPSSTAPALRALSAALLLLTTSGCSLTLLAPATVSPMPFEVLKAPTAGSRCAVLLLPGRWDRMAAFRKAGFSRRATEAGANFGLVAVDAHIGYYREESLVTHLEQDVVPAIQSLGADRVWLVGTSLGGVGSLIYWREHPTEVAGIVLIAPYLGEGDLLGEIRQAEGLQAWQPPRPPANGELEDRIWLTLQDATTPGSPTPILLAFGTEDNLAPGHQLLARELPNTHVFRQPGGHDWNTWTALWQDLLESHLICPDEHHELPGT